jgi:hypothetical protein
VAEQKGILRSEIFQFVDEPLFIKLKTGQIADSFPVDVSLSLFSETVLMFPMTKFSSSKFI